MARWCSYRISACFDPPSDGNRYLQIAQLLFELRDWNGAVKAVDNALQKGDIQQAGTAHLLLGIASHHRAMKSVVSMPSNGHSVTRTPRPRPEPGTVEDLRHEGVATVPLRQDRPHLGFCQDHRQPRRALCELDVVELFELPPEDLFVEEHDSAKRLILGRSRYVSLDRKVGQRALDLGFAHGVRVAVPMEQDEPGLQGCNAFGRYRMNRFIPSA